MSGRAAYFVILPAFKLAYATESKAECEAEEKLEKLKQDFEKDRHDLENQIVALRVCCR